MMTTRQADRLIGKRIVLVDVYGDQSEVTIVSRDRWHVYTAQGHKLDRTDLVSWTVKE